MSFAVESRLPDVGTSIFTVMSKMALQEGAINLSQGFPDFPVSQELISLVTARMQAGFNQYAPMPGAPELKRSIARVIEETYARPTDPDTDIVITSGGSEGLYASISALIRTGDEVLIFDPSYDSYSPAVRLNGAIPVPISLKPPHFGIDWDEVESLITSKTRMIMINTPHNPSGAVLSESDLNRLAKIANQHNLIVLSDEVYERIIFDGFVHQSVLRHKDLADRSLAVFSFGKTFHTTGWKVGYVAGPAHLIREVTRTHQFITFAVNTPVQMAMSDYLQNKEHYLSLGAFYQKKRDFFLNQIKGSSFEVLPCRGSYFQLLGYEAISKKDEMAMAEWLTRTHKVASIPVSVFYQDKRNQYLLRFCFAKSESTLEKAGAILRQF